MSNIQFQSKSLFVSYWVILCLVMLIVIQEHTSNHGTFQSERDSTYQKDLNATTPRVDNTIGETKKTKI